MKTNSGLATKSRIGALDGIRGLAVAMVVMGHVWNCFVIPNPTQSNWLGAILGNAAFGVQMFFVLSGYLITGLLIGERDQAGSVSLWRFYVRRILRIFPAFYAFLAIMVLLVRSGWIHASLGQLVTAATYTKNYAGLLTTDDPLEGSWFLGHLWTLSLEEQFYLIWPLVSVISPRRWLRILPLAGICALPLVRVATYCLWPAQRGVVTMMFHTAADGILMGCAFAVWQQPILAWIEQRGIDSRSLLALMALPLIASPLLAWALHGAYSITIGPTLDTLCAAVLVIAVHRSANAAAARRFLELGGLQWLGRLSYSLYLWQQVFLNPFSKPWTFWWPIAIAASLTAAMVSYYGLELPILRFKSKFSPNAGRHERSPTPEMPAEAVQVL